MSELDKYFEKARNVEPIYEEEDTRKFLAGKLSDGGIATNLYNKIKVYPMLTALITSVATIATIAILSITSSDTVTEKANMRGYTSTIPSAWQAGTENLKSDNKTPEVKETKTYSVLANNDIESKESNENKAKIEKEKVPRTDDNTIDIKTVNSLKLTKDELAKLGIELDQKSFKVNAFDKYTYTIFQSNEKTRDYYKKDEDKDAMPTPAMITTSTGFKTLTLFKKGNVEAIVDRVKKTNEKDDTTNLFNNPKLRDSLQLANDIAVNNEMKNLINNPQMRDLLQRESDKPEVIQITKENIIDLDTSFNDYTLSENSDDKNTVNKQESHSQMDTIGFNNYVLKTDSPVKIFIHNNNPNMKVVNREKMKIVGKDTTYEKESYMVDMDNPKPLTKEELNEKRKAGMKTYYIENVEFVTINNVTMQDSNIVEIKENKQNIKTELEVKDGESTQEFTLKPGQQVWGYEDSLLTNKDTKLYSNMSFDFINYNINELIPIEVSFDGVKTDFIVWYEASEDFLTKLPHSMLEKINPELAAISEQEQHCNNAPIKKDDAVMDVWSGCSGAIMEMKVFPNPANNDSKVEFELEDNRQVSIAVYDLSGKLIKKIKNSDSYSKGRITEALNLNGVNPGLYYVVVKSDIGEQALQRIIIE